MTDRIHAGPQSADGEPFLRYTDGTSSLDELRTELAAWEAQRRRVRRGDPANAGWWVRYGQLNAWWYTHCRSVEELPSAQRALDNMILGWSAAVSALPDGLDRHSEAWLTGALGRAHGERFDPPGPADVDDLQAAITYLDRAVSLLGPGDDDWAALTEELTGRYFDLIDIARDSAATGPLIERLRQLLDASPAGPRASTYWAQLGLGYELRDELSGTTDNSLQAVAAYARALELGDQAVDTVRGFAELMTRQGFTTGRVADIDAALRALSQARDWPGLTMRERGELNYRSMIAHFQRHSVGLGAGVGTDDVLEDLTAVVRFGVAIIGNKAADAESVAHAHMLTGAARIERIRLAEAVGEDVEPAIAHLEQAIAGADPEMRTAIEPLLALTYVDRARLAADRKRFDQAIVFAQGSLTNAALAPQARAALSVSLAFAVAGRADYVPPVPDSLLTAAIAEMRALLSQPSMSGSATPSAHYVLGALLVRGAAYGVERDTIDESIEHLERSFALFAPDAVTRLQCAFELVNALMHRLMRRGDLADLDRAEQLLREVRADRRMSAFESALVDLALGQVLFHRHFFKGDAVLGEAIAMLRRVPERTPAGHMMGYRASSMLVLCYGAMAVVSDADEDWRRVREYGRILVDADLPSHHDTAQNVLEAASMLVSAGERLGDRDAMRAGVRRMRAVVGMLDPENGRVPAHLAVLGVALLALHDASPGDVDLDEAIDLLRRASAVLPTVANGRTVTAAAFALARAYQRVGRTAEAVAAGMAALRAHASLVVLQSGTANAMAAAREAAGEALWVARVCLAADRREDALRALESGRGLVLHAAGSAAKVPDMLRARGYGALADEWVAVARDSPFLERPAVGDWRVAQPMVPPDLRHQVLAALADHTALLASPTLGEITAALRRSGTDALVYLFLGAAGEPGLGLIVRADGVIDSLILPLLVSPPVTGLSGRLAARAGTTSVDREMTIPAQGAPVPHIDDELLELCRWAWRVAISPVLEAIPVREPRLALVPDGGLAAVPWHAAQSRPGGGAPVRWALDDAVISTIASGRLFVEVASRPMPPIASRALVIGNPDTGDAADDLPNAGIEASEIRARYYPAGRYRGRPAAQADGPGSPQDILAWVSGDQQPHPAILHLACHGFIRAEGPATSFLKLGDGAVVSAEEILHAAAARNVTRSLGLVSLAACNTHLAGRSYDEAVTLATAFLTAGASHAIGALWRVPDRETALLMLTFHDCLVRQGMAPREALRTAQRRLRDGDLTHLPDLPAALAGAAGTVSKLANWAGFVHVGA